MAAEPKGILFDLDDTLIAFESVADASWIAVCERVTPDGDSARALFAQIEQQRDWFWSDPQRHHRGRHHLQSARLAIVSAALGKSGQVSQVAAQDIVDAYTQLRNEKIYLLPGAVEVLDHFRARQVPMVLVTNGAARAQREKIERFNLAGYFNDIFVEGERGFGKPEQAIYEAALAALNQPPGEVWSVGDNLEWDVYGPMGFGMVGIWHNYQHKALVTVAGRSPDRVITSLHELMDKREGE